MSTEADAALAGKRVTVQTALGAAARRLSGGESPRLDAEVLLAHVLDQSRAYLLAHPGAVLPEAERGLFSGLVRLRSEGWPVAYLTGRREFWSHSLRVTPATLIPRPETERLVELALQRIPADCTWRIADLGTGSGAVALAIAMERPSCQILATDISAPALTVARHNAIRLGVRNVQFRQDDWCEHLIGESFDLIAANPPYVRRGDPHLTRGDLRFEPLLALEAGAGGLDAIARISASARLSLAPGGWLVLEHGHDQTTAATALLARYGYTDIESYNDLSGVARVVEARRP